MKAENGEKKEDSSYMNMNRANKQTNKLGE